MLKRILKSIQFRLKMARFGIYYLRSRGFSVESIRVAGQRIRLSFPAAEKAVLEFELGKILFEDCYHLASVPGEAGTVLDIGANVGLFDIAARHFFPRATIHSYEPNGTLEPHLRQHCTPLSVKYHMEAVGAESGRVTLACQENSLHSTVQKSDEGIPQVAFRVAIDRLGGKIDLLKLDCEGCEWSLFEDRESWAKIGYLTMEYHLWAKPGATLEELQQQLDGLGFECLRVEPSSDGAFGMLQARNRATRGTRE